MQVFFVERVFATSPSFLQKDTSLYQREAFYFVRTIHKLSNLICLRHHLIRPLR